MSKTNITEGTAKRIVNIAIDLAGIAERLELFEFEAEASALRLEGYRVHEIGMDLQAKLAGRGKLELEREE